MRPLIGLFAIILIWATRSTSAEAASLEDQVVEFCDSPYKMGYVQELFSTEAPPEAKETYQSAKKLPVEAIPICLRILGDQESQTDSRRAGAIGLLSLLVQKPGVSAETKARIHQAVVHALGEKEWSDPSHVPSLGMEYLYRHGNENDLNVVVPFLDSVQLNVRQYAELTYTSMIWREHPDAPAEKMMEDARAQFRAQQASAAPTPTTSNVTSPSAAASSPPASAAVAAQESDRPFPTLVIVAGVIVLLAAGLLVHRLRQTRRG